MMEHQQTRLFSLETFFSPKERLSRENYILANLTMPFLLTTLLLPATILSVTQTIDNDIYQIIERMSWFILAIVMYSSLGITSIKRMHDLWHSGWYCLIPGYNIIALLFFKWTEGDNQFGPTSK
jgi:uncharacterized membrane protein YhaH (DUF805 family)